MTEKFCSQCGERLVPGANFCSGCGRSIGRNTTTVPAGSQHTNTWNENPVTQNRPPLNSDSGQPVIRQPSKKEFRKICNNEKFRKDLKTNAIILYVLVGINTLVSVGTNPAGLIDAVIYLGLTLGMHLGKSKGCAVGVLCYAIVSTVIGLISTGNLVGWLWIIAAYGGIKAFSVADQEYDSIYGS